MLGRYKTQGNYRYKAFDEYRYGHGALLALAGTATAVLQFTMLLAETPRCC